MFVWTANWFIPIRFLSSLAPCTPPPLPGNKRKEADGLMRWSTNEMHLLSSVIFFIFHEYYSLLFLVLFCLTALKLHFHPSLPEGAAESTQHVNFPHDRRATKNKKLGGVRRDVEWGEEGQIRKLGSVLQNHQR